LPCWRRALRSGRSTSTSSTPATRRCSARPPRRPRCPRSRPCPARRASAATPAAAHSRPGWSGTADAPAAVRSRRAPRQCGCPGACPPHRSPPRHPVGQLEHQSQNVSSWAGPSWSSQSGRAARTSRAKRTRQ
jgi:hypothetical protein